MKNVRSIPFFIVAIVLGGCGGQHDKAGHDKAVRFGEQNDALVCQFMEIAPENGQRNWISYFDGYGGRPHWNSFGKLYDRYTLEMQFDIEINYWRRDFKRISEPRFYLLEVIEVEVPSSPQYGIGCKYGDSFTFGLNDWNTLVKNKGDFSCIGIELKKDSPVDHFDRVR